MQARLWIEFLGRAKRGVASKWDGIVLLQKWLSESNVLDDCLPSQATQEEMLTNGIASVVTDKEPADAKVRWIVEVSLSTVRVAMAKQSINIIMKL